jgi:ABC-2 type transport system ATP-binding protein
MDVMSDYVLEVNKLSKNYGPFTAVNGISFKIPKGKVIGLLGPNGAGKTTTIQMLLGITLPTSGQVKFFGKDFKTHRAESLQRVNFASAYNTLQGRISVMENMLCFAQLYSVKNPRKKIDELLDFFDLSRHVNQPYWEMSSGEQTRANLVKALINDPELILMDEPTASLDPDIADKTLSLIEKLKDERGLSILFTSHKMDEVTRICDEVIFVSGGNIVAQDTPQNLTKKIDQASLRITFEGKKSDATTYLDKQNQTYQFIGSHVLTIETRETLVPELILGISKSGIRITDIEVHKPTLEDVFLQIARGRNDA